MIILSILNTTKLLECLFYMYNYVVILEVINVYKTFSGNIKVFQC